MPWFKHRGGESNSPPTFTRDSILIYDRTDKTLCREIYASAINCITVHTFGRVYVSEMKYAADYSLTSRLIQWLRTVIIYYKILTFFNILIAYRNISILLKIVKKKMWATPINVA